MPDTLISLKLPPGIYRNGTRYQAQGRWHDANFVRWFEGVLAPIGGWSTMKDAAGAALALSGVPRAAHGWRRDDATSWLAVGTVGTGCRLYAFSNGVLTDISPVVPLVCGNVDGGFLTGQGDYGEGVYGFGNYGEGSGGTTLEEADTWSIDNFGGSIAAVLTSDGRLLVWDGNIGNDAVVPTPTSGTVPTNNTAVVVTPERFLFVLGAGGNVRKIQWPSQETTTVWLPTAATTAGDFELATNGRLLAGRRARRQTLLWTDTDLHGATFIGGTLVYAFEQLGDNCGLIGPNAVAVVAGGTAYWMGHRSFFVYDGAVRPLGGDVSDYVFGDLNLTQRAKVACVPNAQFGEVTWFYPSVEDGNPEPTRYVTHSYREGHWTIGRLNRSCGVDRGVFDYPVLCNSTGTVYEHERGQDRDSGTPFIESGPIEVGEGERVVNVLQLIPDENTLGDVQATFFVRDWPLSSESTFGPYSLADRTDVRFSARQLRLRLDEVRETGWRVGVVRLGGSLAGYR